MQDSGFISGAIKRLLSGPPIYYIWVLILLVVAGIGIGAYVKQIQHGLIVTGMTSYVSWGLYIGLCNGSIALRILDFPYESQFLF